MLSGEWTPPTVAARLVAALLAVLIAFPIVAVGGGMVFLGVLALGPRKDLAELWICLPAGGALLGVIATGMYYNLVRFPAITASRFSFNEGELMLVTPRYGLVTSPVCDVLSITEHRRHRSPPGRRLKGWWLRLDRVGWVYLSRSIPNAELLVSRLRQAHGDGHDRFPSETRR